MRGGDAALPARGRVPRRGLQARLADRGQPARGGAQQRDRHAVCAPRRPPRGVRRFVLVSTDKAVNPATALGASKAMAEWIVEALGPAPPGHRLLLRAVRKRARLERERRAALPPPDRAGRAGDGHPSRHGALLHDDSGGRAADHPGRQPRPGRRDVRARDGRAGQDHRPGAQHDPALGPGGGRDIAIEIVGPAARREAARGAVPRDERPVPTEADRILKAERPPLDPDWVDRVFERVERLVEQRRRDVPRAGAGELAREVHAGRGQSGRTPVRT